MSVGLQGDRILVSGPARVEDAEALLALVLEDRARAVDLTGCMALHAAVLQVLLAFRPRLVGPAGDPFVQAWLMPLLDADG